MTQDGTLFSYRLFGESHGPAVGVLIEGAPAGLPLSSDDFITDLGRRRAGAAGTTARQETDAPCFLSGLYNGKTTGTPLCISFDNSDTRSQDYAAVRSQPRPGHADWTGMVRYAGYNDPRGSGHFSGRLSVGVVAAGVVAKKILQAYAGKSAVPAFITRILAAGGSGDTAETISRAAAEGDSVGALVELRVTGLPAGLGGPWFDSLEGRLALACFAVPGVRGVEFGDGFAAAAMRGSEHNDPILDRAGTTARNGAGGINGGISNGNDLLLRVAVKPASSIARSQETINLDSGRMEALSTGGRHDACIALRAAVVLEAACAAVLADEVLMARGRTAGKELP